LSGNHIYTENQTVILPDPLICFEFNDQDLKIWPAKKMHLMRVPSSVWRRNGYVTEARWSNDNAPFGKVTCPFWKSALIEILLERFFFIRNNKHSERDILNATLSIRTWKVKQAKRNIFDFWKFFNVFVFFNFLIKQSSCRI